jgi:flagellin-like hook-associated protein FlgL
MDKNELKKALKPLIKECIKEVLLEHGVSSLVTEAQQSTAPPQINQQAQNERAKMVKENLQRQKKKMLDAIGNDAYNGVDLFEGTTPTRPQTDTGNGPLAGTDPRDPGVDITQLPNFNVWKKLAGN